MIKKFRSWKGLQYQALWKWQNVHNHALFSCIILPNATEKIFLCGTCCCLRLLWLSTITLHLQSPGSRNWTLKCLFSPKIELIISCKLPAGDDNILFQHGWASKTICHCYYSTMTLSLSLPLQANIKPYILSLTPRHVIVIVSGTQRDRCSFTVMQHNVCGDILRHLCQYGWTVQSKLQGTKEPSKWLADQYVAIAGFYFQQLI